MHSGDLFQIAPSPPLPSPPTSANAALVKILPTPCHKLQYVYVYILRLENMICFRLKDMT